MRNHHEGSRGRYVSHIDLHPACGENLRHLPVVRPRGQASRSGLAVRIEVMFFG